MNKQLVKVTSAPRAVRVSMSTAVCRVMWRQPEIRAPFRGFDWLYISLIFISPGISFSAMSMALRPHSARLMSARTDGRRGKVFRYYYNDLSSLSVSRVC